MQQRLFWSSKMRNIKYFKNIGLVTLLTVLLSVTWVAVITHQNKNLSNSNRILMYAVEHHTSIMVILVIVSVSFGFLLSLRLYDEVKKTKKDSRSVLEIVMQFLADEEKEILNFLVQKEGATSQAEISRLPNMNRVKAFRSLQKMQDKQLIEIIPHGKIRKVRLKENIHNILKEKT